MPLTPDTPQIIELHPPTDDDGWYASQVRDWVAVCPELGDAAVRLYGILRALVIEKYGPVRKLTLTELCHLLPRKAVPQGVRPEPSSLSRIRSLLDQLTRVGLVTTPEGRRLTTSSRAQASGQKLRMQINLMPRRTYDGPRNALAFLDEIRPAAEKAAHAARIREQERARTRRTAPDIGRPDTDQSQAGRIPDPPDAGQDCDPLGRNPDPRGQNPAPDPRADLRDPDLPPSLPAQSSRSATESSVRPSPHAVEERDATEQRTDRKPDRMGQDARPQTEARTTLSPAVDGSGQGQAPGIRPEMTPGLDVLYRLGAEIPALALAGRPLTDQARRLDDLIAHTPWTADTLLVALTAPFEDRVRTSAGAVVSARISALPSAPRPTAPGETPRSVAEEVARRVLLECTDCGRPPMPGAELCAECSGWPLCPSCGRYRTEHGTPCPRCTVVGRPAETAAECVGHDATGCGTPLLEVGPLGPLCGRCEDQLRRRRRDRDEKWDRAVKDAAHAVAEAEAVAGEQDRPGTA